ncbi:MAG: site-specific DNA-methyltransferase, partial [Candidatus Paceibacterota bacterium]
MNNKFNLSDNEKRDIIKYLESGKPLPEKYRFLLFDTNKEVELLWNGKTDEMENVVLPFQTIEHIDEPRSDEKITAQGSLFDTSGRQIKGWTNKLIWGDNKLILSSLKNGPLRKQIEEEGGLKLIYIDPPFDVGADFSINIKIGDPSTGSGQVESFTKKPSVIEEIAYRDTWGKGADSFIAMIYERLKLIHGLLADDGSIYVHCDWRVVSYLRLIMDEVFGKNNFRREVIWNRGNPSGGKASANNYIHAHDTVLYYSNSDNIIFNKQYDEYSEEYINQRFINDDNDGKGRYRLQGSGDNLRKQYLNESKGKAMTSVWDLADINVMAKERLDYPTQKPEKFLEKIILASSIEGDLIADFFCGSGTTLAVAEKLGRKWIGSDLSRFSIHTTRKRMIGVQRKLKKEGKDFRAFEILNIGKYEREKFLNVNENLREEEKRKQRENKEREFIKLILSAYKAEPVDSFNSFVGKKMDRLVAVGSIDMPVTNDFLERIINECKEKKITKADVLGFDYEMGLDFESAKKLGIDIQFKVIPREVFDKKAVEKGQVKFYDVAYIEAKPIIRGRGNVKEVAIELTDFSVFYNQ